MPPTNEELQEEVVGLNNKLDKILCILKFNGKGERTAKILLWFNEKTADKKEVSLEIFYRYCRLKGYSLNRKTFCRDIDNLVEEKILNRKVVRGGILGTTSILTKNKEEI